MDFTEKSLPLVSIDQNTNKFQLTQEAIEFLCSLKKPVAVISIAGLYRTGKSFLVNKLIRNKQRGSGEGFKVGSTTKSVTKGLNIWGSPITINDENGDKIDYLLIDSEGIGSCEQQTKYDTNILILIFLISSTVIYNSLNAIDQTNLQQLEVILKFKKCMENGGYYNPSPKFIWVLRDFSLQLIDQRGHQMTANQYLQKCLEESSGNTFETKKKNQIRRAIKENLGEKSCYTLVRPTNKQEDLNNLNSFSRGCNPTQPKIRTQFLGQIQQLKEQIFSGSSKDLKIINNQKITGKTLCKILSEYVAIINEGQLPIVSNVWDSITKNNNAQIFEGCLDKLKQQVKKINLPMNKDQLKMKLNQIGNRIYSELQSQLTDSQGQNSESAYKKYHKQFIKNIQKLTSELKTKNDELHNNNTLVQLRQFVKQNVQYNSISPLNVASTLKNLIQRMKLKTHGYGQGYEYLLSVINDVLYIVEQKGNKAERERHEYKLIIEKQQSQRKHQDLILINMKKQYHQALKTVAKFQEGQAEIDKNYSLLKNKTHSQERRCVQLEDQNKREKNEKQKYIREYNQKLKMKSDELGEIIKKLRQENLMQSEQIYKLKELSENNQIKERKQIIFSEKIEESYNKFAKQKQLLLKQAEQHKKQVSQLNKKYQELFAGYEEQKQKQKIQKQEHIQKQINFKKQFDSLKSCIRQTKQSYELTYKTHQDTDKVFKDIQNLTSVKKRNHLDGSEMKDKNMQSDRDNLIMKNYYQNQLNKQKQEYSEDIIYLESKLQKLQNLLQQQISNKALNFEEARQNKQKCVKLQKEISVANDKFTKCLKQIEQARQKQRALYQDSIVRLLNNMDKRSQGNSKRQERISHK